MPSKCSSNSFQRKSATLNQSEKNRIQADNKTKIIANHGNLKTVKKTQSHHFENNGSTNSCFDDFKLDLTNNEPIKLNSLKNLQNEPLAKI